MKKILWFSRHVMNDDQLADLKRIYGAIKVTQVNKTIRNADELRDEIEAHDVIAVVAPLELQKQFLELAGEQEVIICKNDRVLVGGSKVVFKHLGWFWVKKIEIEIERL